IRKLIRDTHGKSCGTISRKYLKHGCQSIELGIKYSKEQGTYADDQQRKEDHSKGTFHRIIGNLTSINFDSAFSLYHMCDIKNSQCQGSRFDPPTCGHRRGPHPHQKYNYHDGPQLHSLWFDGVKSRSTRVDTLKERNYYFSPSRMTV